MEKAATVNAAVLNRNTKKIDSEKSKKKRDATIHLFYYLHGIILFTSPQMIFLFTILNLDYS